MIRDVFGSFPIKRFFSVVKIAGMLRTRAQYFTEVDTPQRSISSGNFLCDSPDPAVFSVFSRDCSIEESA